jgi:hypothetical protein
MAKNLSHELKVIGNIMKVEYAKKKNRWKMYLHHFLNDNVKLLFVQYYE